MLRSVMLVLLTGIWLPGPAVAQQLRFDLGQRVKALESAWARAASLQERRRAVPHLKSALADFFRFQAEEAAHGLDRARLTLESASAPAAHVSWATSLSLRIDSRFVDVGVQRLGIALAQVYAVGGSAPQGCTLSLSLRDGAGKEWAAAREPIGKIPWQGQLAVPGVAQGDYELSAEIVTGAERIPMGRHTISFANDIARRLKELREVVGRWKEMPNDTQRATVAGHLEVIESLYAKQTLETNYPANRLLSEAEDAVRALGGGAPFFGCGRPGDYWLTMTSKSETIPVRLFAPKEVAQAKPLPLVVALHGAGASENLYFEGYGQGRIVSHCQEHGWLLVAPRSTILGLAMPVERLVGAVDRLYPVDPRRVFLIGHSMGAAQAVAAAQQMSVPPLAVAALGGGGIVSRTDRIKQVAFFVGAGSDDFLLPAARQLQQDLQSGGVSSVRFKEYPDVEHIMIVQAALEDVFAWFDEVLSAPRG